MIGRHSWRAESEERQFRKPPGHVGARCEARRLDDNAMPAQRRQYIRENVVRGRNRNLIRHGV
jgi:hypothetical protein